MTPGSTAIVLGVALLYVAVTTMIGVAVKRRASSSNRYITGGSAFGPFVIGVLMMSEFIGTGSTIGTAQVAFTKGISASWNLITLGIAFVIFGFTVAQQFKTRGEYTISGAIAKTYGNTAQTITSLIMIYALGVVNVSMYAGGAATLSALLHVSNAAAVIITGIVTIAYVASGGMVAVVYTDLVHATLKYLSLIIAAAAGIGAVAGFSGLAAHVPAKMFSLTTVGWPTIFAWTVANLGSVFATQYIVQAIFAVRGERGAQQASFTAGLLVVPAGILAALIGIAGSLLFPGSPASQSLPLMATLVNPWLGAIIVTGLVAAVFGTVSAGTIGSSALVLRDFYLPFINPNADDAQKLRLSRLAAVVMGALPIPFAIFTPQILTTIFFARSLRTSIAILVVTMFYLPRFGSARGAVWGLLAAVVLTTAWFTLGNPFGIDNIYVAALTPILAMGIDTIVRRRRPALSAGVSMESA